MHLAPYLAVVAVITAVPGPDTVLVMSRSIRHGRRLAIRTAAGSACGLLVWGAASALGIAAVVAASGTAFLIARLAGAAYLAFLGLRLIVGAGRETRAASADDPRRPGAFRQGMLTNLANPKAGAFFTALLPQFVDPGHDPHLTAFAYAGIAAGASFLGLSLYAALAARLRGWLTRPRVRASFDRVTGGVLLALGARIAVARP